MKFNIEIDSSEFYAWTVRATMGVQAMANTMKEIKVIFFNIIGPYTPYDQGFLQHSFMEYSEIISEFPLFELHMEMTGRDNPDARGFDYAQIQHETEWFRHPIQGTHHYLRQGFEEAEPLVLKRIETDYLSALEGSL